MKRLAVTAAAAAAAMAGLLAGSAPAGAAGFKGTSMCSGAGAPTGTMPNGFGNPGEAIAYTAQVVGHDGTFHPGPIVAINCNPRLR